MGRYKEKIEQLEKCCAGERLANIEGQLQMLASNMPLTVSQSPIALTERGEKVLIDSGVKQVIDTNYSTLKAGVLGCANTKYDIQECSRDLLNTVLDGHVMDYGPIQVSLDRVSVKELKDWLFENGQKVSDLVEVGTVYLRDRIIKDTDTDAA